ncbi:hypothetical protein KUV56_01770 [Ferrimonas balearica]|uniref:LuxR C-terminal-related transcriptional regulator n=1 Tax=Ferrimonas balearica TaxID=44012 RepID=UPI001C5857A9|nr:LuxR C-terminal-related transcriptional regulator [Ferrimonas balearica]MBW3138250.1 hypothetical protein [Ferrimonas balearica]
MPIFEYEDAISSREMIEDELHRFAIANNLEDVFCCYDISSLSAISKLDRKQSIANRIKLRKKIFFSSAKGRNYFKLVILDRLIKDDDFKKRFEEKLYKRDEVRECWCAYDKKHPRSSDLVKQHDYFGYEKKFELVIPCQINNNFFVRFIIMINDHSLNEKDVIEKFRPGLLELNRRITGGFINEINPILDYQYVKPKSIKVLECLAKGQSREDAAAELHLTVRGVDYHIEILKNALSAHNIANLIYKASSLNLLR